MSTDASMGARELVAVKEEYGWRLGRVADPFGHHWEIACLSGQFFAMLTECLRSGRPERGVMCYLSINLSF